MRIFDLLRMSSWHVEASVSAKSTLNPLRALVDVSKKTNPDKEVINLSIGDPTAHGNLNVHPFVTQNLIEKAISLKSNGYPPSSGYQAARDAVARCFTTPKAPLTDADVILEIGGSGAVGMALKALLNPGDNILIPVPGFPLYETICGSHGFQAKKYKLLPYQDWEADINHMRTLIDERTKAILVNNPSNPCGSVYSKEHLQQILAVAEEFKIPIVSDEIYAEMAFDGYTFHPLATLTTTVPILTIGGLAKRFLVPGWRVGWILIHDRNHILDGVRKGIMNLTQLILGPNSLIQAILPEILHNTPKEFYEATNKTLEENAKFGYARLSKIDALKPIKAHGAMYQMVEIDVGKLKDITDDVQFMQQLLEEESVFILPGSIFGAPNFFRLVICAPIPKLEIAYSRIEEFCRRHAKL